MATVDKAFRIKNGLIVEGSTATVNGSNVLTEASTSFMSEYIADTIGAMVSSNTESGITVSYQDGDNTLDFDVADFTITLGGDLSGSVTITDLANATLTASIAADSVALGTDTTGNYVASVTSGSGISISSGSIGEGSAIVVANDDKGSSQNIFKNVAVSGGETVVADSNDDTLTFAAGSGITLAAATSTDTITVTNSDKGSSQNIFKNIVVGAATVVADSNDDTLTFVGSNGVGVLANTSTDTIEIYNTGVTALAGTTNEITVSGATGSITVGLATNPTVAGNLTVTGNLTVNGSTTTLNTETLAVEDNLIILNSNVTSTPSTNAGIEVERGTSTNASLYWDESADKWYVNDSTTSKAIALVGDATFNTFSTFTDGSNNAEPDSSSDTFTFTAGSGISVLISSASDSLTITNDDKGSSQNIFKNVAVSGGATVAADSNDDTLTFSAGTGISLAAATSTDTITVTNSGVTQLTGTTSQVVVSASTGSVTLSLPQNINTDSSPTFAALTLTGAMIGTAINFTNTQIADNSATATTGTTVVDSWDASAYRSAKYLVQMKDGNDIETLEVLVNVDGNNNVYITEYADVISNAQLGTTDADYNGGNVRLKITAAGNDVAVKLHRTLIEA
jgi:hypothetical protein